MSARERAISRAGRVKSGLIDRLNFIEYYPEAPDVIKAVYCRVCGGVIKETVHSERKLDVRRIKGEIVRTVGMVLAETSSYAEIEILFDDGSKHVANLCLTCATNPGEEILEAIYATDLLQWSKEPVEERFLQVTVDRSPISSRIVRRKGQAWDDSTEEWR